MKTSPLKTASFVVCVSVAALHAPLSTSYAQGTAFTYQGRLSDAAGAANGNYDLTFTAYGAATGGLVAGGPVTNSAVAVSNGLFTTTLDFGSTTFAGGAARWLEIAVRTNGTGAFAALTNRQPFTATPYAITARNVTGTVLTSAIGGTYPNAVTFNNPANNFSGNGSGLSGVNASSLGGLSANQFWKVNGNNVSSGQFLGSTNNRALECVSTTTSPCG